MTGVLRIVLPGGAATGAGWVRSRISGAEIVVVDDADRDELTRALEGADAVVAGELGADVLEHARELRLVHVLGAGWDGIAVDALPDGCVVCNVYEHETAIGEWVLMVMLALTRRLIVYDRDLRAGDWHTAFSYGGKPERDLRGSVVGCIGVGSIGSRVVELARSFGMRAIAVTRAPTPERAALLDVEWLGSMDDLQRLLSESDFTVVCVPLTETTAGLLGPAELESDWPYRVPRQRCEGSDRARGASLRGTAHEEHRRSRARCLVPLSRARRPDGDACEFAVLELDNVVMTPHSAGWSEDALERRWRFISEQMARLDEGRPLENVVARR